MNDTVGNILTRRHLPAVWEFLRAISGLASIVVLVSILAVVAIKDGPEEARSSSSLGAVDDSPPAQGKAVAHHTPQSPARAEVVFYLVSSPEQKFDADWGENVDASDFNRSYAILDAGTPEEYRAAEHAVFEYLIGRSNGSVIHVVDLRNTEPDVP